jgi:hypothetical protein
MLHVQCNSCKEWAVTENMGDPDSAVICECCTEDHDHAQAVRDTRDAGCRPVTITVLPGSVDMHPALGG